MYKLVENIEIKTKLIEKFRTIAYDLYKEHWKLNHLKPDTEYNTLCEYADELSNIDESTDTNNILKSDYDKFITEYGYHDECYVCYDEFLNNEYKDSDYMKEILPAKLHDILKEIDNEYASENGD